MCLCVFVDIRLKSHCHLLSIAVTPSQQERPYHDDSTASRLLSEVKHRRARLVLRWGTTLESRVLFFCYYYYFCRGRSLFLLWIVPKNSAGIFFTVTKTTVTTTTTSLVSTQLSSTYFLVLSQSLSQHISTPICFVPGVKTTRVLAFGASLSCKKRNTSSAKVRVFDRFLFRTAAKNIAGRV